MKKLLLSMAAVAAFSVSAEVKTVVFDFASESYGLTRLSNADKEQPYIDPGTKLTETDGVTVTLNKTEKKNGWRLWTDGLRVYKSSDAAMNVSVSTGAITKIEFTAKDKVITEINKETVTGTAYGVTCNGNNIDLNFTVANNGAIYTMTVTVDTNGTGTSTGTTVIAGGEDPEPPVTNVKEVKSIAETIACDNGTKVKVNYELNVAWVSGSNIFVCDNAGDFIQIYNSNSYKVNDVIPAGWEATYELYSGATPELTNATLPAASGSKTFVPKYVEVKDVTVALVNNVVALKDVEFSEATPSTKNNFTGTCNGTELSFRNNYTIEGVEPGSYNVVFVVTIYKGEPSLYVISYDAETMTGLASEIEAENGEAMYFNLQGVRVAEPENGLFIRIQNGKATKVLVR